MIFSLMMFTIKSANQSVITNFSASVPSAQHSLPPHPFIFPGRERRLCSGLTSHYGVVEVFCCRIEVHNLDRPIEGFTVLDHGGAVGAL